jgi:Mu-like prophage FluMu N-terminal domain
LAKEKPTVLPPGDTPWSVDFLAPFFPLPPGISEAVLKNASLVVSAKPARGRRRAGFAFTRDKTTIAIASLDRQQIAALAGDAELDVSLRVQKPDVPAG